MFAGRTTEGKSTGPFPERIGGKRSAHSASKVADSSGPAWARPALSPVRGRPWQRAAGSGLVLQRKCADCEEEQALQRKAEGEGTHDGRAASDAVEHTLRSSGKPLDEGTRRMFEPVFGRSFEDVRVHDDASADASARAVSAKAYTVGNHIAFRRGALAANTTDGKQLLAHELTHVVQQSGAGGGSRLSASPAAGVSRPSDAAEIEADRVAAAVMGGAHGELRSLPRLASGPMIHRELDDEIDDDGLTESGEPESTLAKQDGRRRRPPRREPSCPPNPRSMRLENVSNRLDSCVFSVARNSILDIYPDLHPVGSHARDENGRFKIEVHRAGDYETIYESGVQITGMGGYHRADPGPGRYVVTVVSVSSTHLAGIVNWSLRDR